MEKTISIKELFTEIAKKWKTIVLFAVIGAVVMNVYGYSKAVAAEAAREDLHKRYVEAAPELPGYYTEELFAKREALSEGYAELSVAYAKIYREFLKEYGNENTVPDNSNLESYMFMLGSYKDIISIMSVAQRSFFDALVEIDTEDYLDTHPIVTDFVPNTTEILQTRSVLIGLFFGAVIGAVIVAVPVINRKCK